MKKLAFFVIFFVFSVGITELSSAQYGLPAQGRDYYIGYIYPSINKNSGVPNPPPLDLFQVTVLISSYYDNHVTVTYFDPVTGVELDGQNYGILAGTTQEVLLSKSLMKLTEPGEIPEYKACHITSEKPITVQYLSRGANSGGSYLPITTLSLGKDYVIPSYNDNPGNGALMPVYGEDAGGFFLIIAPYNGTTVQITPNGLTAGGHIGVHTGAGAIGVPKPYAITLSRGQCYLVKGDGSNEENDLSGSTVISNKPISVIAGHEDAYLGGVGDHEADGRDFMVEQIIPTENWDSTGYVSIPFVDAIILDPKDEADKIGLGDNYRVYTDNPSSAQIILNDGSITTMTTFKYSSPPPEKFQEANPVDFYSTDGHKFGVMMYDIRGMGTDDGPSPAESMMSIVPASRWQTSYLFGVPANIDKFAADNYINIIGLKNDFTNGNIKYSFLNNQLSSVTNLSRVHAYLSIPGHPELEGLTLRVSAGSTYYITNTRDAIVHPDSSSPAALAMDNIIHGGFMVYQFGKASVSIVGGKYGKTESSAAGAL